MPVLAKQRDLGDGEEREGHGDRRLPPAGDWLARRGGAGLSVGALAEAGELGLDDLVGRSVLSELQRDAPPRFDEALAAAEAPARRAGRSRSASRGPPEGRAAPGGPGAGPAAQRPRLAPLPGARPSPSPASGSRAPPREAGGRGSDDSLVSSMAARLAQVEQLNKRLSAKVAEQSQEIADLHAKLAKAEHLRCGDEDTTVSPAASPEAAVRAENEELRAQLADMRDFLAEYGLQWVPRSKEEAAVRSNDPPATRSGDDGSSVAERLGRPRAPGGVSVDITVIEARVEALNALVEEGGSTGAGQRVGGPGNVCMGRKPAPPVPLTFFSDGIKLGEHAFLPFELPSAQELLKDILDGYFPKALQREHQGGVALRVVDRTGNRFAAWLRELSRDDPELADGGERLRPAAGRAVHAPREAKTPGERLLERLPERVVRNGRVCEVRGPLAAQLAPGRAPAAAAAAAAPAAPPSGARARGASEPPAAGAGAAGAGEELRLLREGRGPEEPVARLRVRLEGGQQLQLCMEPAATLGALWDALERWRAERGLPRAGGDGRRRCLRSAFPPRAFTDHGQTLAEAGLTPSAALFVSAEAPDC